MSEKKISVLIIDDSHFVQKVLKGMLSQDPMIEVIGCADDPYQAKEIIIQKDPDVVTLDIEMPRMDGLTFLKLIMERRPRPVIMMSTLTQKGSDYAMEALRLGAFEVFSKPEGSDSVGHIGARLIMAIKVAANNRNKKKHQSLVADPSQRLSGGQRYKPRQMLLLGASTGGTEALKSVLTRMPKEIPATLIVQHIPAHFSTAFANRLNDLCAFDVKEAEDGDKVKPGLALVAPGDFHMTLEYANNQFYVKLNQGPMIWHQRPAVDVTFKSAMRHLGSDSVGAILTGMGRDGADGLLEMKQKGCKTYAQDEESSVVFGMPKAAWEQGAADELISLDIMPQKLLSALAGKY